MANGTIALSVTERARTIPLDEIDVSEPELWRTDSHWPYFERLRREDPVHYCARSAFGPYWSITKYHDIMAIDTNHQVFSSEAALGGITIDDETTDLRFPMFIAMDPPKHDEQRKAVSPAVSPANLQLFEPLIRERAARTLDNLPRDETFDWVDRVSETYEAKAAVGAECLAAFTELWNQRVNAPPRGDLVSVMAHADATRHMTPREYLGNLILLIVGGNDTTRNTITGSVLALNQNPDQYQKLRDNPALLPSMVSETIRWQTPLAHMRRTALQDIEFRGKHIKKGDKVVMWYVSGNRDGEVIENPDAYLIERAHPRNHLSFGFGIHRCVGNRLAELQLRVIWEEILKRFPVIEVVGEPQRVPSPFVKGYVNLPVRIPG